MRLIVISDLHGSLDRLELLLELTNADAYIFTGDLLYNPFSRIEDLEDFYEVQMLVRSWRRSAGKEHIAMPLWLRQEKLHADDQRIAQIDSYMQLAEKARQSMLRKYRALERTLKIKPRSAMFVIGGNYDLDLSATALSPYNLHRTSKSFEGMTFGGYGGAPVFTSGVPEHLAIKFHEDREGRGAISEPYSVLSHLQPDVAVVHTPPLGLLDGSPSRGFGSWGLRNYLDETKHTKLLLCGHVHTGWGAALNNEIWVVNSGNFGQVVEGTGYRRGGYFAEVTIGPDGVESAILKRLERSKIWHLIEYRQTDRGRLDEHAVEPRRVAQRRNSPITENAEEAEGRRHISEHDLNLIEHYNQIKLFLRRFETTASEQRIDDLREMVSWAREHGTEIAFDVLGSVNMGQSTDQSDVDAILYIEDDPANNRYDPAFWPQMVHHSTGGRYEMEFTDIIDLWEVREAIEASDAQNEALQRFVIYRAIGRPVNVRLLRQYDDQLLTNSNLRKTIQRALRKDLEVMAGTYRQHKSFQKYMERIRETGVRIPARIQMRVHKYLHTVDDE